MGDYISRDAALIVLDWDCASQDALDAIKAIPAADVVEVRRGRWKPRDLTWGRSYYYCTICEETVDMPTAMGIPMFKYCPSCGAKMDGGQDDV